MINKIVDILTSGKSVLGPQTPLAYRQVVGTVFQAQPDGVMDKESLKQIKVICLQTQNWQEIAKIIESITAGMPHNSHEWLNIIVDPVSLNRGAKDEKALQNNPHFILGLSLGLFRSAIWLDTNWGTIVEFYEDMLDWVVELIVWNDEFTNKSDRLLPDKTFESQLSQAIKSYFRTPAEYMGAKGIRMAQTQKIIEKSLELLIDGQGKKQPLSKISSLILEQLSYAYFGTLVAWGKMESLYLSFPNLKLPERKEKALVKNLEENKTFQELIKALATSGDDELEKIIAPVISDYIQGDQTFACLWKIGEIIRKSSKNLKGKNQMKSETALDFLNILAYAIFEHLSVYDKALASIGLMQFKLNDLMTLSGKRQLRNPALAKALEKFL